VSARPLQPGAAGDALLADVYELTMLQAYWREGMDGEAVFSLFFRRLPPGRNYALACGLDDALRHLEGMRFDADALSYLRGLGLFGEEFLETLQGFRFRGDVYAVPEGTPVFPGEPLLEVVAPIGQAQLAESFVMNQVHLQTVLASKAARVVTAAAGRRVIDFGMRRMHGAEASLEGARAFYAAGVHATSNLRAGQRYGIPVSGTMAHSYVQAHEREEDAFAAFAALYPETVLLVDTYDTLEGVRRVVDLARRLGQGFRVSGIRLDSGDLAALSRRARDLLDAAGLSRLSIVASGDLDEDRIAELVGAGAPIDAFGVGTRMGVSADAPGLDLAYKLTQYAGRGRLKFSPGKATLPGRKQVFRVDEDGCAARDVIALEGEALPGRALLEPVMRSGRRTPFGQRNLEQIRRSAAAALAQLPQRVRALEDCRPPFPVEVSPALRALESELRGRVG
jgi:nicotinate phosphoribosyltransferase